MSIAMTHRPCLPRTQSSGFSLVELMITLMIVVILAAMALPAWRQHFHRAWRMQARAEAVTAMLALERHALSASTFASALDATAPAGHWPRPVPAPPAPVRHWLTATSCAGLDLSRCVEVRATPTFVDTRCGTLVLRSTGEWLSLLTAANPPARTPEGC
ncbi:type IV pilin protein [Cupriavidus sp. KB_39]|jgi:type IV pilus assembly protein PilE|uniref:type IV pilin protein n=1 Tax=Cupriavidus sp. KB_39 TaxID=3233036 RepID=UPI003F8F0EA3